MSSGYQIDVTVQQGYQIDVVITDGYAVNVEVSGSLGGAMALGDWAWGVSPVESPDGSRTRFTLPDSDEYVSGKIFVIRDRSMLLIGNGLTVVSGSQVEIDFETPPDADESLYFFYIRA